MSKYIFREKIVSCNRILCIQPSTGEGRLDFYHRSLSKAARKRYFSGEDEDEIQRKRNFWHGVLADYFERVEDLDRKAEELPYHLEKLMDNNRLVQCLMDWNVFERM